MNRLLTTLLLCAACSTPASTSAMTSPGKGDLQIQVVPLAHVQAEVAAKALTETMAGTAATAGAFKIAVQSEQNALVLSGTAADIRAALAHVASLDVSPGR